MYKKNKKKSISTVDWERREQMWVVLRNQKKKYKETLKIRFNNERRIN